MSLLGCVENLALVRLLPEKGLSIRDIETDLGKIQVEGVSYESVLDAACGELIQKGYVQGSDDHLSLSASGRKRALEWLKVDAVPASITWAKGKPSVAKGYLVMRALGIGSSVPKSKVSKLQEVKHVRMEVLRQYFELELPPLQFEPPKFDRALAWKLVGGLGGPSRQPSKLLKDILFLNLCDGPKLPAALVETVSNASETSHKQLTNLILSYECGLSKCVGGEKILSYFTNHILGLPITAPATELSSEIVKCWLRAEISEPGSGWLSAPSPLRAFSSENKPAHVPKVLKPKEPLTAQVILETARQSEHGWGGSNLVFINHVWRALQSRGHTLSLDEFKSLLLEMKGNEELELIRADSPHLFDRTDINESHISYRGNMLVFIKVYENHERKTVFI